MRKQAVYKVAMPPDQSFDRLIPFKPGFRRKDKHVWGWWRAGCRVDGAGGEIRERRAGGRHDPPDDEKEERKGKRRKCEMVNTRSQR